ncbi:TIGR01841 family phasin [Altererythrobacter aerius]|uniref:TIGR01841 family phasin n=1 Tax=Tsuneonella aeria TaxID=1837929 RepID=A0A6I4TI10_9SPHN|nr:phasin family protein [Tsuneonella aeria]MXO76088.1 TIGR01841 family phasin [Tsuneonella aeria]
MAADPATKTTDTPIAAKADTPAPVEAKDVTPAAKMETAGPDDAPTATAAFKPKAKAEARKSRKAKTAAAAKRRVAAPPAPKATTAAPRTPTVSQLKDKIMATAKTTDFTATVQNVTAEAQTRAKAAYDKMQAAAGEMTEFTKGNVEALVESGKILGTGMQSMARGEVEAAKDAFETVTADLKAMAAVRTPTDLFKLQGEIARRNFDAMVAHYAKNAEVSMKLANEAFAPISSRMSVAAEAISKAA